MDDRDGVEGRILFVGPRTRAPALPARRRRPAADVERALGALVAARLPEGTELVAVAERWARDTREAPHMVFVTLRTPTGPRTLRIDKASERVVGADVEAGLRQPAASSIQAGKGSGSERQASGPPRSSASVSSAASRR